MIEYAPTPHDLRHSHASALIAGGWDVEAVSRRLGHASAMTTLRTYTHEYESARRCDAQRDSLAALYGSAVEAPAPATTRSTTSGESTNLAQIRAIRSQTG